MQTTQLICPHCGSMVNLSGAIAPGTPVNCLICMQSFAAAPIAVATVTPAKSAPAVPTAPKPQAAVLTSKPFAAVKSERTMPARQNVPSATQEATGSKAALWTVSLGMVILLTAGGAFAFWKLNDRRPADTGDQSDEQLAASPKPKDAGPQAPVDQSKSKDAALDKTPNVSGTAADDDDLRRKKEAQKNHLKRKPTIDGGPKDPESDPITTIVIPASTVPGVDQDRVNAAVERGVVYLRRTQAANGLWNANGFPIGATALGGLTLLECKKPSNDPNVQRAAAFVRGNYNRLGMTYEISLAILFLDRLGDPRDRALIQGLALRLLAGQRECGGWSYDCPALSANDMYQLYTFLRSHQPASAAPVKGNKDGDLKMFDKKGKEGSDPIDEFGRMIAEKDGAQDAKDKPPADKSPPDKKSPPAAKKGPLRPEMLPPQMRMLPVVQNQGRGKGNHQLRFGPGGGGDNSNTQFALLALWAARRHAIPSDSAILSAYQRFVVCQSVDFGWGYHALGIPHDSTNTMTCVGLLGMAMGHGVAPEIVKADANDPKNGVAKPALQDPKIANALKKLAKYLGDVSPDKDNVGATEHMYFLWSVERVAVLYDLNTIDGKDWYGYGAQKLLKHQMGTGDWPSAYYPGVCPHVNTCFALLFLKRSNLVSDLTLHLRLATPVRD